MPQKKNDGAIGVIVFFQVQGDPAIPFAQAKKKKPSFRWAFSR